MTQITLNTNQQTQAPQLKAPSKADEDLKSFVKKYNNFLTWFTGAIKSEDQTQITTRVDHLTGHLRAVFALQQERKAEQRLDNTALRDLTDRKNQQKDFELLTAGAEDTGLQKQMINALEQLKTGTVESKAQDNTATAETQTTDLASISIADATKHGDLADVTSRCLLALVGCGKGKSSEAILNALPKPSASAATDIDPQQLYAEMRDYLTGLKDANLEEAQSSFQSLSPEAQHILHTSKEANLRPILEGDTFASMITERKVSAQAQAGAANILGAAAKQARLPEMITIDQAEIDRRDACNEFLANLVKGYESTRNKHGQAYADHQLKATMKEILPKENCTITQNDLTRVASQLRRGSNPTQKAQNDNVMGKLLENLCSSKGALGALAALPMGAALVSRIPIFGKYLAKPLKLMSYITDFAKNNPAALVLLPTVFGGDGNKGKKPAEAPAA